MRTAENNVLWVVYQMTVQKQAQLMNAVCSQDEWDAMERARPGHHQLVRAGIRTECEAELLARGTSGDAKTRATIARCTG